MMSQQLKRLFLPVAFAAACAVALTVMLLGPRAGVTGDGKRLADSPAFAVQWRTQMPSRPNAPACQFPDSWVVTDRAGGVTALSSTGVRVWHRSFSNQVFEAAAFVSRERIVVASQEGHVTALRNATGEVVWSAETDAQFQHQPLGGGFEKGEPVVSVVSQTDGRLFRFRLRDGACVWKGEETNRCDGEPAVLADGSVAYGNCDGAVYLFDAAANMRMAKIAVGGEDQMAGGLLSIAGGGLAAGTRQGDLVVVDAKAKVLRARVKVSPGEAFVKPVLAFDGLLAMGTQEGLVSFWRFDGEGLQQAGSLQLETAVDQLDAADGRLFILAGGVMYVLDKPDKKPFRLVLGDEVHGLRACSRDVVACVADGAVVCLKGGR